MEKQKPFKLFVPPRLSSSQVSAVKPQSLGGDSNFFKSFNKYIEDDFSFPFAMTNLSKNGENIDSDPALQKVKFLPMLEQVDNSDSCPYQEGLKDSDFENSEPMSRLYSKLYKEAEKIKKWKVNVESELKQKENKLQENRKIIEAQRKAIQELQFENEKVSLKLEEGIQENKDLIKENNATRHLCNLLKETCARSAEKTKKCKYISCFISISESELFNLKNELLSVKKQLEIEKEEKEKLKREAKENIVTLEKRDKKIPTPLLETPETHYWKFDSKAAPSQNISRNFTSADHGKSKDKRDYLWTSAKSTLSTPLPKAYTVKTPTKLKIQQRENKNVPMEESNKKRKMVFEFDINSDSSETTDLLSMVSEEETLKKLYKTNNPTTSHLCVRTPKKTPSSLTTPGSTLKFGAMRKMREDRWAVIAKMDRKKKLKDAEKLFV
ncbi:synaptonemal complex protein 1 [Mirounga angustirostris]|uniref:synaptonemal complex protein 1 n=1 Tax=Mirounga angustirostris TaxID=9716 RepID=UPI00313AAAAE